LESFLAQDNLFFPSESTAKKADRGSSPGVSFRGLNNPSLGDAKNDHLILALAPGDFWGLLRGRVESKYGHLSGPSGSRIIEEKRGHINNLPWDGLFLSYV
jgi:hypothetical protein